MWAFDYDSGTFRRASQNGSRGFEVSLVDHETLCPGCNQNSVYAGDDTDLICVKCEKVYFGKSSLLEYDSRPLTAIEGSFLDYISSVAVQVVEMLEQLPKCWTFDRG